MGNAIEMACNRIAVLESQPQSSGNTGAAAQQSAQPVPAFPTTQPGYGTTAFAQMPASSPGVSGGGHPTFNPARTSSAPGRAPVYSMSDSRNQLFEDKVAIASNMQYSEEGKRTWLKTMRNYLISKAFEMNKLLPWAESAQYTTLIDAHIAALENSDDCMDNDPHRLSRELWGTLTLHLRAVRRLRLTTSRKGMGLMHGDALPCLFFLGVRHGFTPCITTSTALAPPVDSQMP